jgi:hypothetical protein
MQRVWVNKADSSEAADILETKYYKGLSSEVRVENIQLLRETHFKSTGLKFSGDGKRFRRILSVIKQA